MITGMLPSEAINYKLHMVCTRTDVMYTVWYIQYIYLYTVHAVPGEAILTPGFVNAAFCSYCRVNPEFCETRGKLVSG